MGFWDGFFSLSKRTNTVDGERIKDKEEGVIGEKLPVLTLNKDDEELIEIKKKWEDKWEKSGAKSELERKQKENEKYWLGDHNDEAQKTVGMREMVDNLVFEALETFLPIVTRKPPEPVVEIGNTEELNILERRLRDILTDVSDEIRIKMKIKKAARHWALYYLGVIKMGWDMKTDNVGIKVIRPQLLVLDPDAITDECEYDGDYIGEYRTATAEELISRFPLKSKEIKDITDKMLGTKIKYVEWWTPEYVFWTLRDEVLGKSKNPHWNYQEEKIEESEVDDFGVETIVEREIPPYNHFTTKKIPYCMLSVFNLGKHPFDDTTLIEQVLPLQDLINKRVKQIDKNADQTNGGLIIDRNTHTEEEAQRAVNALRKGGAIYGDPSGIKRETGLPLPQFVYQSLQDYRSELRGIFGITGLSPGGIKSENTVRGKIIVKGQDTDRAAIVVDHLEQFSDYIFNWIVQLLFVYQPERMEEWRGLKINITIKEGSLIPKDSLTQRNEAIELWSAGALDPETLFEKLEFDNPKETAQKLILWKTNPMALLQGDGQQMQQQMAQPQQGGGMMVDSNPQESLLGQVPIQ